MISASDARDERITGGPEGSGYDGPKAITSQHPLGAAYGKCTRGMECSLNRSNVFSGKSKRYRRAKINRVNVSWKNISNPYRISYIRVVGEK